VYTIVVTASANLDPAKGSNQHLSRAQRLIDNLRYAAASKELELALGTEGNDRPSLFSG